MLHALRCIIWFPFAIASSLPFLVVLNVATYIYARPFYFGLVLFWSLVIGGLALPFAVKLRPPMRNKAKLPARARSIERARVRIVVRIKGRAPQLAGMVRRLGPPLQMLMVTRVGEPEAIIHERRFYSGEPT